MKQMYIVSLGVHVTPEAIAFCVRSPLENNMMGDLMSGQVDGVTDLHVLIRMIEPDIVVVCGEHPIVSEDMIKSAYKAGLVWHVSWGEELGDYAEVLWEDTDIQVTRESVSHMEPARAMAVIGEYFLMDDGCVQMQLISEAPSLERRRSVFGSALR